MQGLDWPLSPVRFLAEFRGGLRAGEFFFHMRAGEWVSSPALPNKKKLEFSKALNCFFYNEKAYLSIIVPLELLYSIELLVLCAF